MANFKSPRIGSNVVHRIELPEGRRKRNKRGRGREVTETRVIVERVAVPAPEQRRAPEPPKPAVRVRETTRPAPLPRDAQARDSQARKQIELLERRLAKMARLLEDREGAGGAAGAAEIEDGVASIYREVQGLGEASGDVKQKKALMSKIFEANLDLRNRIISGSPHPA